MYGSIEQTQVEAAYAYGHRILAGPHSLTTPILESSDAPLEACLVSVSEPKQLWVVGLGGESWIGRRLAQHHPSWPTDAILFEGRQFSYHCRPSGVWLEDMHTTNGTFVLSGREAVGFSLSGSSLADTPQHRLPHPNLPLPCRSLYRWVARDADILVSYEAFVLCHPPTRLRTTTPSP